MQRALLIHNDQAGDGKIGAEALAKILALNGMPVRHCLPNAPDLAACLAGGEDLVVVAGGDGTVARILAQLPDRADRRVALVPLGTANNIAQSLGVLSSVEPGAGEEILTAWAHADLSRLDIGLAEGPWGRQRFVEAVGVGPLARTILQFKSEGLRAVDSMRLGREAFAHALKNAAPLVTRVRIDEADLEEEMLLAEVMNIQHAGSRVRLAPQADTGDGLFDVVTISPAQRADFLAWLAEGSEKDPPPVTWRRARSVVLDWRGEPLHIDDHGPAAEASEGRVTVRFATQRLSVLVPSRLDREAAKNPAPKDAVPRRSPPGGAPALERETS